MKYCMLAFLVAGNLLADGLVGVGEDATFPLPAGELKETNYVVDGQLRKTAAGEQQLEAARLAGRGEVLVTQGTLQLVSGDAPAESSWKPTEILAKAAMWIDVSEADTVQLVEGSSENVYQILDVREPDRTLRNKAGAYVYPHWMAHTNIAHSAAVTALGPDHWFPTYHAAADGEPSFVDFGGYQSGQSLKMYNAKGADSYLSNVRHIFVVAGTFDYKWGFLLNGGSGTYTTYVPQSYSASAFGISAYYCWLNNNEKQQISVICAAGTPSATSAFRIVVTFFTDTSQVFRHRSILRNCARKSTIVPSPLSRHAKEPAWNSLPWRSPEWSHSAFGRIHRMRRS